MFKNPDEDSVSHRELLVVQLIYLCTLCCEGYMSKAGLWHHLNVHKIDETSKELHYQEVKATQKFTECVLCNDQRAYSEMHFKKHVQDDHDGFYMQCTNCGEKFKSDKLKNDHNCGMCKTDNQSGGLDCAILKEELILEDDECLASDSEHLEESNSTHQEQFDELQSNTEDNYASKIITDENEQFSNKYSNEKFACDNCEVTFLTKRLLVRHKNAKYSCIRGKKESCPHCSKKFHLIEYREHLPMCEMKPPEQQAEIVQQNETVQNFDKIPEHSNTNADAEGDMQMSQNYIAVKSEALLTAEASGEQSNTKCIHCEKECGKASNLRLHLTQAHQPSQCNICGITFEGYDRLRYHKRHKHKNLQQSVELNYTCGKCSEKFYYRILYLRHLDVCDVTTGEKLNEPECTKCCYCEYEESCPDALAGHILHHHDPVACDFCGLTLSSFTQAQQHMKSVHNYLKLKCPHCLMRFTWKIALERHSIKCEKERFPCELCGKMFENEKAVKRHIRYKCLANTRNEKGNSKRLAVNESNPVICYYCNETLPSSGYLCHHLKNSHELTKCGVCEMTVIGISGVKYHKIKTHTEPKFDCTVCGRKFHYKKDYVGHTFQCQNETYPCDRCGRSFQVLSSLTRHRKSCLPKSDNVSDLQTQDDQSESTNVVQNENDGLEMDIKVEPAMLIEGDAIDSNEDSEESLHTTSVGR